MDDILETTPSGFYCRKGDFHIDPWRPVKRAVITHAHADHARPGSRSYLCSKSSELLLRSRLGHDTKIETLSYGERLTVNSVNISLHPAGHILGSCQARIEVDGNIWVVSGDYKTEADSTCEPIEILRCHTFVSECTFGLPIFRWFASIPPFAAIRLFDGKSATYPEQRGLLHWSDPDPRSHRKD